MKWKKPSQQTVAAATQSDLPDECWECIFRFVVRDDLDSVSLVSKRFLSISDRLRFSILVENGTLPILNRLLERFTNLKSLKVVNNDYDFNNLLCNISHFPLNKLTSLYIFGLRSFPSNGLRVFSQKITTLTSLTCYLSFLRNEDDLSLIAECFPLLEKLNIYRPFDRQPFSNVNNLNFIDGMHSLLSKCRYIQHLDLSDIYFLNDQHVAELSLFLAGLKSINLSSCFDLTESALFSLIRKCPSLNEIKMGRTSIGKVSAGSSNSLRDFVVVSPQLKSLCLAQCEHLKDENIILFSSIFPNLELLDLSRCGQISEGIICHVLRRCCKIRHLNLAKLEMNLHGINFVVPKLEMLDLSLCTKVDDKTLYVISKNCPGLLELCLKCCAGITPEGVKHVLENCTLRKMYLVDFHISNEIKELFSRRGCLLSTHICDGL